MNILEKCYISLQNN